MHDADVQMTDANSNRRSAGEESANAPAILLHIGILILIIRIDNKMLERSFESRGKASRNVIPNPNLRNSFS